jgi:hypothetical protein
MRNRLAIAVSAFLATMACTVLTLAQTNDQARVQMPASSAATAGSSPNFSGVWNALRSPYDVASFSKGDPPMTAWGLEQFKASKPSQGPRGVLLGQTNDMVYQCYPPGLPYIYLQLFPMEIVQTPKEVIELFEYDHFVRHIYVDGRKHTPDVTPTYDGESIGHWEGDTLVVDTVGLNGKIWLDRVGHPDSDQMHITERIHRTDEKTLQVDFTFDDPKSYVKPWTAAMRFGLHPTWDIMEDICEDNRAFDSFEK